MIVPDGFGEAVRGGRAGHRRAGRATGPAIETDIVLSVVDGVLDQLAAGTVAAAAALARGLSPDESAASASQGRHRRGRRSALTAARPPSEQLSPRATLVAGQAGLFLLFTVGFGVLGLLAEREQGTLARLRSMPMRPGAVVVRQGAGELRPGRGGDHGAARGRRALFDADFGSPVAGGRGPRALRGRRRPRR